MDGWMVSWLGRKGWRGVEGKANVELRAGRRFVVQAAFNSVKGVQNQGYLPQGGSRQERWAFCCNQRGQKSTSRSSEANNGSEPVGPAGPVTWMDGEVAK